MIRLLDFLTPSLHTQRPVNQKTLKTQFSIEEVADIAGINSFTLRNWEDRYGLFSPGRDGNGRRLFSESDTIRAVVAAELTKRRHKISKVAVDLQEMTDPFRLLIKSVEGDSFVEMRQEALAGLLKYDSEAFQQGFSHLLGNYSIEFMADHFFYPIYRELEELEGTGKIGSFQFRYCQQQLADRIYRLAGSVKLNRSREFGGKALVSGFPENRFEDSTLILYLVLERQGWEVIYGGPNICINELPEVISATQANVVLFVGNNLSVAQFEQHEEKLRQLSVPFSIGGKLAQKLLAAGKQSTPQLEITTLRPGPFARLLRCKVGPITQTSKTPSYQ